MKRNGTAGRRRGTTARLAVGTAAGVAVASLGLFAAPAFAGNGAGPGDGTGTGTCDGTGVGAQSRDGSGSAFGYGRGGAQNRAGSGVGLAALEMGELTEEQKAELVYWVEEEKMAHDLYTAFADQYDAGPFARVAASETRHMDAVRLLLDRYGLDDPTEGAAAGAFEDEDLAALYADLLAQGDDSYADALAVGRTVEATDIEDLGELLDGLEAPDVEAVATKQVAASERHLAAFGG